MALPVGVTTATITFGVPVSFTGGAVRSTVSIVPSASLVHTATGTPLVNFIEDVITSEGVSGQFTLPHTDQLGFQDESGNSYQNWYYTATISYSAGKTTLPPRTKTFQLPTGQTTVDLDLLPAGAPVLPYTAATANVTSFHGRIGAVTVQDSDLPSRLSDASLNAAYAGRRDFEVSAREFDVKGDGTDETVKLQTFLDYLADNAKAGVLPDKEYLISAPLNIKNKRGWKLRGMSKYGTSIKQTTDNVHILNMGVGGEVPSSSGFRDWEISDLMLTYSNVQPSTNTEAIPMYFVAMGYEAEIKDIYFQRGFYGIKVALGQAAPWGVVWDGLHFGPSLSGGAIDWTGTIAAIPNNHFRRMFVEANAMIGPVFSLRGYNTVIDAVEIINADLGPRLLELQAGSRIIIHTIKLEQGSYLAAQSMFNIQVSAFLKIGYLFIGGGHFISNPATSFVSIFNLGSGGGFATLDVDMIEANATETGSVANGYVFAGDDTNRIRVGEIITANGWQVTAHAWGSTCNQNLRIDDWSNGATSRSNLGDANVTVALGNPQTMFFETPFTAQRTVTLPSLGPSLVSTLSYSFVLKGAVNGANTFRLVSGSRTIYTHTDTANCTITVRWRRTTAGQDGWYVASIAALPA